MVGDTCVMEWMTSLERMVVMAWLPESVFRAAWLVVAA